MKLVSEKKTVLLRNHSTLTLVKVELRLKTWQCLLLPNIFLEANI